jgi:hypothetical protein
MHVWLWRLLSRYVGLSLERRFEVKWGVPFP